MYFPGPRPREKYSPFLLVFSVYFCPLSMFAQTTMPSAIGLPWASLQTPFTLPEACPKTGGIHSPSASSAKRRIANRFFILPPGKESILVLRPLPFDEREDQRTTRETWFDRSTSH